ncbi:hypothetical protein [Mycolicibacterium sediminis]|uniref:Uncharacterized protein n=1 Tax=Mycolicibacterium sediminis TaxID=1286180 RepID=A0A7I7QX18_9MYCO|nr:hypothetical protein [Mycolicibacterium sediminis]BBY30537.1 hypothetical protein MSEDJ_46330 [Mycolicibacterium sediminis]
MAKRKEPVRAKNVRRTDERRRPSGATARRTGDSPTRGRRPAADQRPARPKGSGPQTSPIPRPAQAPGRPKNAAQAKARAKARKAKAPKIVRPPLRERLLVRLSAVELNPRELVGRVPFVVLVIGALGLGLGVTLWLSTDAAERSYELGHARQTNQALMQQKDALERDVLEAQAAPALAESARQLGMIPSRDTAHLVQDPAGAWIVVGTPKPAEGVQPPPLNMPLPEPGPPAPPPPPAPRVVEPRELTVRMPERPALPLDPAAAAAAPGAVLAAPVVPGAPVLPGAPAAPVLPAAPGAPVAEVPAPAAPPIVDPEHLASPQLPALPGPPAAVEPPAPVAVPAPGTPA